MKNIIFLVAICVFFLSVADARNYQNSIKSRKKSIYSQCFDEFHPIINPMTNTLRRESRNCIITANNQRKDQLAILESSRLAMVEEMQRFKESMNNCTTNGDHFVYAECVSDIIRSDRKNVNEISSRFDSTRIIEEQIERDKHSCIQRAVSRGQEESSQAFRYLEKCLENVRRY